MRVSNRAWRGTAAFAAILGVTCATSVFSESLPAEKDGGEASKCPPAALSTQMAPEDEGRQSDYQNITGLLIDKSSAFSEEEKSREIEKRMCKFAVEHAVVKDGSLIREQHVFFFYKCRSSLRGRLDALSIGDRITIRGRWEDLEAGMGPVRERLKLRENPPMSIFIVDAIDG